MDFKSNLFYHRISFELSGCVLYIINNNITIYKAHNVRKKLNLRRRQSLGGGKSNSV